MSKIILAVLVAIALVQFVTVKATPDDKPEPTTDVPKDPNTKDDPTGGLKKAGSNVADKAGKGGKGIVGTVKKVGDGMMDTGKKWFDDTMGMGMGMGDGSGFF